jgi:hypothetical protein
MGAFFFDGDTENDTGLLIKKKHKKKDRVRLARPL